MGYIGYRLLNIEAKYGGGGEEGQEDGSRSSTPQAAGEASPSSLYILDLIKMCVPALPSLRALERGL